MTDEGYDLLVAGRPGATSTASATTSSTSSADEDFAALGRVMDAVADHLVAAHPEMEIATAPTRLATPSAESRHRWHR